MTKRTALSPLACTAIAAVLAAVSTPVLAQDTAVPDPAPAAAAPAPIVLPEFKAAPIVQTAPEPAAAPEAVVAATAAPKAERPAARTSARGAPAAAAAPVAAQAAATTTATPVANTAPVIAAQVPAPIASAESAAQPAVTSAGDNTAEIGLGVLGLVAFGGLGAYAATRRRRSVSDDETRITSAPLEPVAQRETPPARTSAVASAAPVMFERKPALTPEPALVAGAGSAALIPPGPLPTGDALVRLFDRMALAAPDEDNPFKGDKRRRQRVRWLMKQHEYRLREPGHDGFDFRKYAASSTPAAKLPADERAGKEVIPA